MTCARSWSVNAQARPSEIARITTSCFILPLYEFEVLISLTSRYDLPKIRMNSHMPFQML